ncbi:hypothetical protein EWM64_g5607 [Hericium alpestre]|uniref:ATP-dependent rRNA helicase SPB4-like C-terminal extension domain-containing protein n=1 Tax=Hericium alpestre TaxID=135208 RepID=A0A4Y9ZU55_9AGAM|nr:hypothetical protein EWM64_g5607 [Hericium alpestre]
MRNDLLGDRALHDKAVKAFVSFVRAYSNHEASYIFRIKDLDLLGVAKTYGLLRLPRMPELKKVDRTGWSDVDMDWNTYAYADKAQETKRLFLLSQQANAPAKPRALPVDKTKYASWSDKVKKKGEKEKRREKKDRKKGWLKTQNQEGTAGEEKVNEALKRNRTESGESDGDEWEELAREERMAKKLKKGTVSQGEFDDAFSGL